MAVPARVAADAAAADVQLQQLAEAARTGSLPVTNEPPQPTNPTPVPAPAPELTVVPAPAPAPVPTAQPVQTDTLILRLQQQMSTLEGRLAAETTERARLAQQLEEARRAPPPPPAQPAAPPISDDERKDFGEDTITFITKLVGHYVDQAVNKLGTRLAQIEGRMGNVVQQVQRTAQVAEETVAERYLAALSSAVPDWQSINVDQNFIEWLQKVDKASNKAYIDLLTAAHEQGNAGSVIYIFNLYKQEKGLIAPATPAPTTPAATPPGFIDPKTLAAPDTTAPATPPTEAPQGKIWSMAEVDKLYSDFQKKNITPQVFAQREQEYMRALAEGRVAAQ